MITKFSSLAVLILSIGSIAAFADSNLDPKIIIKDPASCSGPYCSVGNSFTFSIAGDQKVQIGSSANNNNWYQLLITWNPQQNGIPVQNVSGGVGNTGNISFWDWTRVYNSPTDVGLLFFSARPDTDPNSPFYGNLPPITPGTILTLNFAPDGKGHWTPTTFTGRANSVSTVPEPGTLTLLVSGVAALATRRKFWKSSRSCNV